jgi:putative transposase
MRDDKSLSHTRWDCKYHIVFIPKRRQRFIFGGLRKHLGKVFQNLVHQKGVKIEEVHLLVDHVDICLSIPSKH